MFCHHGSSVTGDLSITQISDGASAVLLMKRGEALKRGLPILGIFRSFAAVGVDPAVMGIGPAVAIPAALEKAGLTTDDIDVYELNEAFASQVCACTPSTLPQYVTFRAELPGMTLDQLADRVDTL